MFKILSITILILVGIFLVSNSVQTSLIPRVFAQIPAENENCDPACEPGLIPCGRNCDSCKTLWNETDKCTLCHILMTGQTYIGYLAIALAGMSLLVFVIIGFMFFIGSVKPESLTTAKSALKSAIIGFILVLTAWLIVTTLGSAVGWKENQRGTYGEEGDRLFWQIECNPGEN